MEAQKPPTIEQKVGENVRLARQRLGLSQEAFALKAEMSRSYYTRIETGKANITIATIGRLAKLLCVSPSYLLRGADGLVGRGEVA